MAADLDRFLQMLFPWDEASTLLFKSCTWSFYPRPDPTKPNDPVKKAFANYAAQRYEDFVNLIVMKSLAPFADTYVALGTQRMADTQKLSREGYPRALRQQNNIVSLNSIWLDLDVKPGAYNTTEEAGDALDAFVNSTGLPPTSMEVLSGSGGMHAYWCTDLPMASPDWSVLAFALRDAATAFGLRFDPQCTVNPCQILRVPGTWNYKSDPRRDVVLLQDTSFDKYTYAELMSALKVSAVAQAAKPVTVGMGHIAVPAAMSAGKSQNFIANTPEAPSPEIDAVAENCGVVADTLKRAGAGDSQPLWSNLLALAAFTADPVAAAHRMSSGYATYTPAETDQKLQEKLNKRANDPGFGWIKCAQFHTLHPACQTCPFKDRGLSPLNFAPRPQPAQLLGAPANVAQHPTPGDPLLPTGFWREASKHVFTRVTDKEGRVHDVDVLGCAIHDGAIDDDNNLLVMRATIGGSTRWRPVSMVQVVAGPAKAAEALSRVGIHVDTKNPEYHKTARNFLVAWMNKLQELKKHVKATSFGWNEDRTTFTFDDRVYKAGGPELTYRNPEINKHFTSDGDLVEWQKMLKLVYGNPALETVVATAFAAPLVGLINHASLVVSVYSGGSAAGKTTALRLAQGVWGQPFETMSALDDTLNSVMRKAVQMKSLPMYWDELKTSEQIDTMVKLVFNMTQGKGKARLNRDSTPMDVGTFETILALASNRSIAGSVYRQTIGTDAGGLRVFEIEATPLTAKLSDTESRAVQMAMSKNYGMAGIAYADWLAKARPAVEKALWGYGSQLEAKLKTTPKERFWLMTMQVIAMGARCANTAGITQFNTNAIENFLDLTLAKLRASMLSKEVTTLTNGDAREIIADLLADGRGKFLLVTDIISQVGAGRPLPVKLMMAHDDVRFLQNIWVQFAQTTNQVRVHRRSFDDWLVRRGFDPEQVVDMLRQHYIVTAGKVSIGAGIDQLNGITQQRWCWTITPKPTSPGSNPDGT